MEKLLKELGYPSYDEFIKCKYFFRGSLKVKLNRYVTSILHWDNVLTEYGPEAIGAISELYAYIYAFKLTYGYKQTVLIDKNVELPTYTDHIRIIQCIHTILSEKEPEKEMYTNLYNSIRPILHRLFILNGKCAEDTLQTMTLNFEMEKRIDNGINS